MKNSQRNRIRREETRLSTLRRLGILLIMVILSLGGGQGALAMGSLPNKKAIVIADFGTAYPSALGALLDIQKTVQKAFPKVMVRMAFTSNIIRDIWHGRQDDARFLAAHRQIPREILHVKGPLATIAELQDAGYRTIVVQPTLVYDGEEYTDLCSYIRGLNAIRTIQKKYMPFVKLVIGRPVLGKRGTVHDYHKDLAIAAKALAPDVALAMKHGSALVYMGHGNRYYSTGIYAEFQQVMQKTYPKAKIFIGTVEGFPSLEDTLSRVTHSGVKRIMLKPLMVVAGDHARNDMAGNGEDSWKNIFERAGLSVTCIIKGLGENMKWDQIYVEHIREAAQDGGITFPFSGESARTPKASASKASR